MAACSGIDTDMFFPLDVPRKGKSIKEEKERTAAACRVCRGCPVREQCLEFALENNEQGVWGATTPQERERIKEESAA